MDVFCERNRPWRNSGGCNEYFPTGCAANGRDGSGIRREIRKKKSLPGIYDYATANFLKKNIK